MTDIDKLRAELRAGLAGTTPGEWRVGSGVFGQNVVLVAGGVDTCPSASVWGEMARVTLRFAQDADGREWYADGTAEANACHIALASPQNVAALLNHIDRLEGHVAKQQMDIVTLGATAGRAEAAEAELARLRAPVEGEKDEAADKAANFVFDRLAEALKLETWTPQDGSETWDGDVAGTLYGILRDARVLDPETDELATAKLDAAEAELARLLATAHRAGFDAAKEQAEDAVSELIVTDARGDYERALDDAILSIRALEPKT